MSLSSLPSSFTSNIDSMPPLIDVDCNLWHVDLKSLLLPTTKNNNNDDGDSSIITTPLPILLEDAVKESNIVAILSPSSTLKEARTAVDMLECFTFPLPILTTVGIHPYHVNDDLREDTDDDSGNNVKEQGPQTRHLTEMASLLSHSSVCAVGECGLDASDGFPPLADQIPWFQVQVQLAEKHQKPLFVHERLAFTETLDVLQHVTVPILIHCFTGLPHECQEYIKRGYYLSVSGYICKNGIGESVRQCLEQGLIPLDRLMIETDAPYMGFDGCRRLYLEKHADYINNTNNNSGGLNAKMRKRLQKGIYPNVPSALPMVLDEVVQCLNRGRQARGEDDMLERHVVARHMTENAIQFFGFQGIEL